MSFSEFDSFWIPGILFEPPRQYARGKKVGGDVLW